MKTQQGFKRPRIVLYKVFFLVSCMYLYYLWTFLVCPCFKIMFWTIYLNSSIAKSKGPRTSLNKLSIMLPLWYSMWHFCGYMAHPREWKRSMWCAEMTGGGRVPNKVIFSLIWECPYVADHAIWLEKLLRKYAINTASKKQFTALSPQKVCIKWTVFFGLTAFPDVK